MLNRNELIRELEKIKGVDIYIARVEKDGAAGAIIWYFEVNKLVMVFNYRDLDTIEQHFTNFSYQTILEIFQRFE